MSYEHLSARQRQILDMLMNHEIISTEKRFSQEIADRLQISEHDVKHSLREMALKYQISIDGYHPRIRLVYLRAKELGLI